MKMIKKNTGIIPISRLILNIIGEKKVKIILIENTTIYRL
jgi:hypothetical protein